MVKKYTFWLKASIVFQLLTAGLHSFSFVNDLQPTDDRERQLLDLMNSYKLDFGMGFTPTMQNLMTSFSIGFTLLLVLGGTVNWFLLAKKADLAIVRGVIGINVIVFGALFIAMLFLTFMIPIVCQALIFIALMLAYLTAPKRTQ